MNLTNYGMLFAAALGAQSAIAADEENGKFGPAALFALPLVEPGSRRELANSPPFEMIAQKFGSAPELIAFAILSAHPTMNLTPSRRDAQDIAAYIATLAK